MGISINTDNFIYPYFVINGSGKKEEIANFPGQFRFSIELLVKDLSESIALGLNKVLLFGIPEEKDILASSAYAKDSIVAQAVKKIKTEFPDLTVMTDICLCAYTSHGHCGILKAQSAKRKTQNEILIDNKKTLEVLTRIALRYAEAGADWVAPSAMAEGQVEAIRKALDKNGFPRTKVMGYSAKFASNFYGPFRDAAGSAPKFGDRNTYQLNYADRTRALREIENDIHEGADVVMVKPALSYLDIISEVKKKFNIPLAAYNVSGEYSLVKLGAESGLWDEKKMVYEIITSIKRAGADIIITYHAKDVAKWQKESL